MNRSGKLFLVALLCAVMSGLAACTAESEPVTATLIIPTVSGSDAGEAVTAPATATLPPPTITTRPTLPPPVIESSTPPAAASPSSAGYRVVFVEPDDTLNVRAGAGIDADIVGELAPDASGIDLQGVGRTIDGSLWVRVIAGDVNGWVNSRYLTAMVATDSFCDDMAAHDLLVAFREAMVTQDGDALAALVDEERGLRVRRYWHSPEVLLRGDEIRELFTSTTSYDWGVADGSGLPITGPFSETLLPLVERNLAPATEVGCNEILAGGTAGSIKLPESYDGVNYFSMYRPAGAEQIELDWGSWVVGVERWNDRYVVSFFVHYEWEI